jgi:hypothetical protein
MLKFSKKKLQKKGERFFLIIPFLKQIIIINELFDKHMLKLLCSMVV